MNFRLFTLLFSLLFIQINCGLSSSSTYTSTDSSGNTKPNYVGIIAVLAGFLIQAIFCFICYKNTQRLRVEAQTLRQEIGAEYEAIKQAQFMNMQQLGQFNYFLVYPNDPRFQGGRQGYGHQL